MIEQDHSSGPRVAILNVVGLCSRLLGKSTPRLSQFARQSGKKESIIKPVVPAVTCTAQSTYLTGKTPNEHGIVGNGWYDRTLNEHHFWKQSNRLVEGEKIWETLRDNRPDFTCANLFWWYNMYSSVDYSITPRPLYRSDGLKKFDIHSQPLSIRNDIKKDLGEFPFPAFWGPRAGIDSSQWIAEAARWIEERHQPDLNLIYLPHLDYDLQRYGPNDPRSEQAIEEIDELAGSLIEFLSNRGVHCIVLSEYGITEVNRVIYPNRALRHQGWLSIKDEFELDTLDSGGSRAFALTDHQVAHIYIKEKNPEFLAKVKAVIESLDGVAMVLEGDARKEADLDHPRAGDLIALAEEDAWFSYYFWEEDEKAPEFARCIDIHRKHGFDPAELFVDPKIPFPNIKAVRKLIAKKLGFRIHMDLIPLNANLVKGSHGIIPKDQADWPVVFGNGVPNSEVLDATEIHNLILNQF
jgi:predicted AlkP superfamily pyrophosphatase or phosphodiesterase